MFFQVSATQAHIVWPDFSLDIIKHQHRLTFDVCRPMFVFLAGQAFNSIRPTRKSYRPKLTHISDG